MIPVTAPASCQAEVRLVSLSLAEGELARLRSFLTADELQRGNRLLDERRRNRFFAGRGFLREVLGQYIGAEPATIALVEGEFGKLHLRDQPEADTLRFNVSHAGDYLLVAVAAGREVGIDLEEVRQDLPFRAMAERYFSAREQEELFSLGGGEQIEAFYRCWTRKEAYMKGTGTGFSQPSTGFDVSVLPQHPAALLAHREKPDEPARWSISDIDVPDGFCAALAVENL